MREALASAVPPPRKVPEREAPALGAWTTLIRAWLVADRDAPRMQRHTARRVHQRLVAEYGANVAESTVRAYVAQVNLKLNDLLAAGDVIDDARHIARRPEPVGVAAAAEVAAMAALPDEAFDTAAVLSAKVDTKVRISVRQSFYSVPVSLADEW